MSASYGLHSDPTAARAPPPGDSDCPRGRRAWRREPGAPPRALPGSRRFSEQRVVDLDEQVEQEDPGLFEDGAPGGAQERIGKVAPLGGRELATSIQSGLISLHQPRQPPAL